MSFFDEQTAVERLDDGLFEAQLHEQWWVARGPHGGYVASIILRALIEALPDSARHPRSFSVHYVAAPELGPLQIAVDVDRRGGSLTFMSARVTQGERPIARALGAFAEGRDGIELTDAETPELPPKEQCFPLPKEGPNLPAFIKNFDLYWGLGDAPFTGSSRSLIGGWISLVEPRPCDALLAATYLDAWPPVVFPRLTAPMVAPTIDLTFHFRRPLPLDGSHPGEAIGGVFRSSLTRDGFFDEEGELWSPDGRLLAQSRQLALLIPVRS